MMRRVFAMMAAMSVAFTLPTMAAAGAEVDSDSVSPQCVNNGVVDGDCFSMLVSPAKITMTPEEVDSHTNETLTLWNNGTTSYSVEIYAVEFTKTRDGTSVLGDRENPGVAAGWVNLSTSKVDLSPGEATRVTVSVDAPDDAEPGDHNVSVVFRRVAEGVGMRVTPQIGAQLLFQTPGEVIRDVAITTADADSDFLGITQSGSPQMFTMAVANRGNVHERFTAADRIVGKVTGFGAPEGATIDIRDFSVVRDHVREVTAEWSGASAENGYASEDPPGFCLCEVTFSTPSGNGEMTYKTVSFIIFPIWQTGVAILALAMIVAVIVIAYRRGRSRGGKSGAHSKADDDSNLLDEILSTSTGAQDSKSAHVDRQDHEPVSRKVT